MKGKSMIRVSLAVAAAVLLLLAVRIKTTHPLQPYAAPDFTLPALNGVPLRLSALRGKAVVLNFWATWCSPCREEIPSLVALQNEFGSQGLQVLGVSLDEGGRNEVAAVARRLGMNYPVLAGNDNVASLYGGVDLLPTTYYISREGKVVAVVKGVIEKSEMERDARQALQAIPENRQRSTLALAGR